MGFIGHPLDVATATSGTMMYDTVVAAMFYPEYFWLGNAYERFLAYGVFEKGDMTNEDHRLLSRGRKMDGRLYGTGGSPTHAAVAEQTQVRENAVSSYYIDPAGQWRHPLRGKTVPSPTKGGAYTWIKSPRYLDTNDPRGFNPTIGLPAMATTPDMIPFEVGPLARMMVNHNGVAGVGGIHTGYYAGILYDAGYQTISVGPFAGVKVPVYVLDRIAARQLECWITARAMVGWLDRLEDLLDGTNSDFVAGYDPAGPITSKTRTIGVDKTFKKSYGWTEAPRGALGHWMRTAGPHRKISLYQAVVPSTWNASPKDQNAVPGPAEKAMENIFVMDANYPLEILRCAHSWDFCMACAVHLVTPTKAGKKKVVKTVNMDPRPG
jgi:hydrogenase large subunit